jgi:hypothetical protein
MTGQKTVLAYVVIIAVLLLGLIKLAYWPIWAALLLAGLLAVIPLLTNVRRRPQSRPSVPAEPFQTVTAAPPPPVELEREQIANVRLPSGKPDYHFIFSGTICWRPTRTGADGQGMIKSAVAIDSVVQRARTIAANRDPVELSLVRPEMARALGALASDTAGHVYAMAESVELALPEDDQRLLDKLAAVRKQEDLWEHERRYEQSKREYLGEDVLKSPGSAVVWWLARNEGHLDTAVSNIGPIRELSNAANDVNGISEAPSASFNGSGTPRDHQGQGSMPPSAATDHLDALIRAMGIDDTDPDRTLFGHQVADLVAKRGHQSLADEMALRFDPWDPGPVADDDRENPGVTGEPPSDNADEDH